LHCLIGQWAPTVSVLPCVAPHTRARSWTSRVVLHSGLQWSDDDGFARGVPHPADTWREGPAFVDLGGAVVAYTGWTCRVRAVRLAAWPHVVAAEHFGHCFMVASLRWGLMLGAGDTVLAERPTRPALYPRLLPAASTWAIMCAPSIKDWWDAGVSRRAAVHPGTASGSESSARV
jgi:hypothetical protein